MSSSESKYIHPLGRKIRKYRLLRNMTQKELGELCGLNESTIRNYELGNRYPDENSLRAIADALHIDRHALADPDPTTVYGALHILFDLEDLYGITPIMDNGTVKLVQKTAQNSDIPAASRLASCQLQEALQLWAHIRKTCDDGNLLDEEYTDWKSRYPDWTDVNESFGWTPNAELQENIESLSQEAGKESVPEPTNLQKRPRKSKRS
jgi:transcriptional regulator with XRE-family HTH domain